MKIIVDGKETEVAKTLAPGRVIISQDGVYLFADLSIYSTWHLRTVPASQDEILQLEKVIEDNGGFDHTTVVKEPV